MKKSVAFILIFSLNLLFAEKIVFSANSMSGQTGNSSSTTILSGNAYIKTESMEIQADKIILSGEDYRNIKSEGHVSGKNTETNMDFTCDELSYDRETKIATLKGNVELIDTENNVKAQAQIIEYNQDTDIAIIQIKINLTQKDNVCSGSYAVYNKKEQMLEISGNAQVKQKDDVFRAQHITLNMDTQDIILGGNVKGTVTDSKKEESSDAQTTEPDNNLNETEDIENPEDSEKLEDSENSEESEIEESESIEIETEDTKENIGETDGN